MNNNIDKYIGFAIKSNSAIIGQDAIKKTKQKILLIILCDTASKNLIDLASRYAKTHKSPLIIVNDLSKISHIDNCKIIALSNENLTSAILLQTNEYKTYEEKNFD